MPDQYSSWKDLRVTQSTPQIAWRFKGTPASDSVLITVTGSGAASVVNGQAVLQTGAAATSSAKIQTTGVMLPTTGTGVFIRIAALFSPGVAGSTQWIGMADDGNGYFFGYNGTQFGIMIRSGGAETFVSQTSWNVDKLSGPVCTFTLDPTKGNIYIIDTQGFGYGNTTFSVQDPVSGYPATVHNITNANNNTLPTLTNPNLPIFAQVNNMTNNSNIAIKTPAAAAYAESMPNPPISGTQASQAGNLYSVSTGGRPVPNNGFLVLQLSNPSGSGKTAFIQRIIAGGLGDTFVDLLKNATFSAVGTLVTPCNLNFYYPDQSILTTKYIVQGADTTLGGQLLMTGMDSTGTTSIDYNGSLIIPEGSTFLVRVTNPKNAGNSNSITICWSEIMT